MRTAKWLIGVALIVTVAVYWVGLHGPFVLDDTQNLKSIAEWLRGDNTWRHALLQNTSGMFGRSLSMATLMLSAWLGGFDPFAFKLGNLVVHLLCGLVGWQVLRRALTLDNHFAAHADLTAALLTSLWLLHPLNVSTVLYAVQRMAQVSTLLTLAALWTYLASRMALDRGQTRRAAVGLFALFPLLLIAGLLGKENAAVAPGLCLILEVAYFRGAPGDKRAVTTFHVVFLALPALLAASLLLVDPGLFLRGYAGRDFTLPQRLLSEGRVLMDYIGALLLPRGPTMGIFTDDFVKSIGLFSPPTTAFSLLALAAISTAAIMLRKRAPSVFAGWFFFLVAHAVESSFLPLELYFEHRNYLPAFGLLLACAGLAEFITRRIRTERLSRRQLGIFVASAYALAFAIATHGRALVWSDEGSLLTQEARYHPQSMRANVALALYAVHYNHADVARKALGGLLQSRDPRTRELGFLNRVLVDCVSRGRASPSDLTEAKSLALPRVTLNEAFVFEDLASVDVMRPCDGAGAAVLAATIETLLSAAHDQPDEDRPKWRLRSTAADLHARTGDWTAALRQAKLAWQPGADAAIGEMLVRAYMHNGMRAEAELAYGEVAHRAKPGDANDRRGLEEMRKFLDSAENRKR